MAGVSMNNCTTDKDCFLRRLNTVCSLVDQTCKCNPWYGWGGENCTDIVASGPLFLIIAWNAVLLLAVLGMWFGIWDFAHARASFQRSVQTSKKLNAAMITTLNAIFALILIVIWGAFSLASVLEVTGLNELLTVEPLQAASSLGRFEVVTMFVGPLALIASAVSLLRTALMWIEIAARSRSMRPVVGANFRRTNKVLLFVQVLLVALLGACWAVAFKFASIESKVSIRLIISIAAVPLALLVLMAFCVGSSRLTHVLVQARESIVSAGGGGSMTAFETNSDQTDHHRKRGSGGFYLTRRGARMSQSSNDSRNAEDGQIFGGGKRNSLEALTSGGGKRNSVEATSTSAGGTPAQTKRESSSQAEESMSPVSRPPSEVQQRLPSVEDPFIVPVLPPPTGHVDSNHMFLNPPPALVVRQGGSDLPPPMQYHGGNAMRASRWRRHAMVVQRTNLLISVVLCFGLGAMVTFSVLDILYGWRDGITTNNGISVEAILWMVGPCMMTLSQIIIIGYVHFASSRSKTSSASASVGATKRRGTLLGWGSYGSVITHSRRSRQGSLVAFEKAEVANPAFGANPYLKKTLSHIREEPSPSHQSQAPAESPHLESHIAAVGDNGMILQQTRSFQTNHSRATASSIQERIVEQEDESGGDTSESYPGEVVAMVDNIVV